MTRWAGATLLVLALAGCDVDRTSLTDPMAEAAGAVALSRSAAECENVSVAAAFELGPWMYQGEAVFGGQPQPVTLAGIEGEFGSFLTGERSTGIHGQGAIHWTLTHVFVSAQGGFLTEDRAVCAPAGNSPVVCRVNDHLEIVSGDGVFADARGFLHNHGVIDFVSSTMDASIRGRLCGSGLQ
jgi:hypothetical protein